MKLFLASIILVTGNTAFAQQQKPELQEAVQPIQLPPTQSQELRQINAGRDLPLPSQSQPEPTQIAIANPTTDSVAKNTSASESIQNTTNDGINESSSENSISNVSAAPTQNENTLATENVPPIEVKKQSPSQVSDSFINIQPQAPTEHLLQQALIACGAIVGLGILGLTLVRLKKRGGLGFQKAEQQMEIVSQLTLSPKRKIILVRIRDQEIALASTETGISMLTEVQPLRQKTLTAGSEPRRISQKTSSASEGSADLQASKKPDLFSSAFKNLKAKAAAAKETEKPKELAKTTSTLSQGKNSQFPKYLANAFQQEGNRKLNSEDESLENVTNMIREKLKNFKQEAV